MSPSPNSIQPLSVPTCLSSIQCGRGTSHLLLKPEMDSDTLSQIHIHTALPPVPQTPWHNGSIFCMCKQCISMTRGGGTTRHQRQHEPFVEEVSMRLTQEGSSLALLMNRWAIVLHIANSRCEPFGLHLNINHRTDQTSGWGANAGEEIVEERRQQRRRRSILGRCGRIQCSMQDKHYKRLHLQHHIALKRKKERKKFFLMQDCTPLSL